MAIENENEISRRGQNLVEQVGILAHLQSKAKRGRFRLFPLHGYPFSLLDVVGC